MTDRESRKRPVASLGFVSALVCLQFVAQILSFLAVSGIGAVKIPCLGISCGRGLANPASDVGMGRILSLCQMLFQLTQNDGEPDRVECDSTPVLMCSATVADRSKLRAHQPTVDPTHVSPSRVEVEHPSLPNAPTAVSLPIRLRRLLC